MSITKQVSICIEVCGVLFQHLNYLDNPMVGPGMFLYRLIIHVVVCGEPHLPSTLLHCGDDGLYVNPLISITSVDVRAFLDLAGVTVVSLLIHITLLTKLQLLILHITHSSTSGDIRHDPAHGCELL